MPISDRVFVEVARAIMWLISEDASYTTGSFVEVSGGR